MTYAYVRVSTEQQTQENQRFEINSFCGSQGITIDQWVAETVSGTSDADERRLGKLLKRLKKGDLLICTEISRLGRNLLMIMGLLHECMKKDIHVWTIKDHYRLGNDINSKVLAFAFALSAEIERNLISQRTKEALARKKAEGVMLGRPMGSKNKKMKLSGNEQCILSLLQEKKSYTEIGKHFKVHPRTVKTFVKGLG
ncbi:MAG: master DNA invertase Mpi family serine-type recombinase [Chitinophagaceae bacterium]